MASGTLYVVATPIGNLEDLSPRAQRVLRGAALIAAEDTRHTRRLLAHFEIATPLVSCHEHNERQRIASLLERLETGDDVALVSDAGTPCISDPGARLVAAVHEAGHPVVAVPGPCAVTSALAVSGLSADRFMFHGFFPRKAGEAARLLEEMGTIRAVHIAFESPNRAAQTLERIAERWPQVPVVLARELTKMHEEVLRGTAGEVQHRVLEPARGECVILLDMTEVSAPAAADEADVHAALARAMRHGMSRSDAVRAVSATLGLPRNAVYAAAVGAPQPADGEPYP